MQLFINIFLIVFTLRCIKGEINLCGDEKEECNIHEIFNTEATNNDENSLVKHVIQYFHVLNQKYENKINTISSDIGYIKNTLQTENKKSPKCQNTPQPTSNIQDTETVPGLYDNLWIIIQRRQGDSVNFFRKWDNYKRGFGNPFREFFIGLDKIHYLTSSSPHELLIKLEDFDGNLKYALYDEFLVGDESEKYQLKKLGNYSGNAGDFMRNHAGMYFSTRDRDNDASVYFHCALRFQSGWWYNNCLTSNLNGPYRTRYVINNVGITWGKFDEMQVHTVQMMVRSKK